VRRKFRRVNSEEEVSKEAEIVRRKFQKRLHPVVARIVVSDIIVVSLCR